MFRYFVSKVGSKDYKLSQRTIISRWLPSYADKIKVILKNNLKLKMTKLFFFFDEIVISKYKLNKNKKV